MKQWFTIHATELDRIGQNPGHWAKKYIFKNRFFGYDLIVPFVRYAIDEGWYAWEAGITCFCKRFAMICGNDDDDYDDDDET